MLVFVLMLVFMLMLVFVFYLCWSYSTPRRSLRVRPDAGRVWTIFPPTHWTHEYLASVHHWALASASVCLCLRPCFCVCVRASAYASVLLHLRPCVCVCVRASTCPSAHLRIRPPICVSIRASACPSARLCVRPCVFRSGHAGRASAGNRESPDVFSGTRTLLFVPYNKRTSRSFSRIDVY